VAGLHDRGVHGIVLGCTEISVFGSRDDVPQATLFDTTGLPVDRAVRLSLGGPAARLSRSRHYR
jgi:aspartate/glutamate racemase